MCLAIHSNVSTTDTSSGVSILHPLGPPQRMTPLNNGADDHGRCSVHISTSHLFLRGKHLRLHRHTPLLHGPPRLALNLQYLQLCWLGLASKTVSAIMPLIRVNHSRFNGSRFFIVNRSVADCPVSV